MGLSKWSPDRGGLSLLFLCIFVLCIFVDISLDSEVGFSAKLSHELHDLSTFSVIKYDYVIFNAGNGYDPNTGIFTVPVEGMYMFTYFVEALGKLILHSFYNSS